MYTPPKNTKENKQKIQQQCYVRYGKKKESQHMERRKNHNTYDSVLNRHIQLGVRNEVTREHSPCTVIGIDCIGLVFTTSVVKGPRPQHIGVVSGGLGVDAGDGLLFRQFLKFVFALDDIDGFRDGRHGEGPTRPERMLLLDRTDGTVVAPINVGAGPCPSHFLVGETKQGVAVFGGTGCRGGVTATHMFPWAISVVGEFGMGVGLVQGQHVLLFG